MKKQFKGKLAKKVRPRGGTALAAALRDDKEKLKEIASGYYQEDIEKLMLLKVHYEIDKSDSMFYELSLALARDFVPGFQEKKKRGRKTKWTFSEKMKLAIEIESMIDKSHSIDLVCGKLAKKEIWKSFLETRTSLDGDFPDPQEALRQVYYSFKEEEKRLGKLLNKPKKK